VLAKSDDNNYLAMNHHAANVSVRAAVHDASATNARVLDCGTAADFPAPGSASYRFRATP